MRSLWHIVAYDIRDASRLRRVHRVIIAEGYALQESVFLLNAKKHQLGKLLDKLAAEMDTNVDDLRAYPVQHPAALWLGGAAKAVFGSTTAEPELEADAQAETRWLDKLRQWARSLRKAA